MSAENKPPMQFFQVVAAVIVGLLVFKWIDESQFKIDSWILISIIAVYIVGGTILEQWKQSQKSKAINRSHLEEVKKDGYYSIEEWHAFGSHDETSREWQELAAKRNGFKSFDEYMLFHAPNDELRNEWQAVSNIKDEYEREEAMRAYDRKRKKALNS